MNQFQQNLPIPRETLEPESIGTETEKSLVIVHYTHENRFNSLKRDMHEIFRKALKDLGVDGLRLIVSRCKSPAIQRELTRKQPNHELLTIPLFKKNTFANFSFPFLNLSFEKNDQKAMNATILTELNLLLINPSSLFYIEQL